MIDPEEAQKTTKCILSPLTPKFKNATLCRPLEIRAENIVYNRDKLSPFQ
jgi:hypothetical protein